METTISSLHLNAAVQETCRFFMQILKTDDVTNLPEYDIIYENYPDDSRINIISFVISASISVFCQQPQKYLSRLIIRKVGSWRALVVNVCQEHGADIHHLPLEIDIFAARNKVGIDCLICHCPFCSPILSQLLEFLSEAFHGSFNVAQPLVDDYFVKFNKRVRRSELIKCIANAMKWLHAVKRSPSHEQSKDLLKDYVMNIAASSEIIMTNHENQYDEVWQEILQKYNEVDDYERNRVDSYKFYCSVLPVLDNIRSYMQIMFVSEETQDSSKLFTQINSFGEMFESSTIWGSELSNIMLTALNTIATPALFVKQKSFPKKFENNFKIFINKLAEKEPINQPLVLAELNYWIDRFKRKKVSIPMNSDEYCTEFSNTICNENAFGKELEEYFSKILLNESRIGVAPGLMSPHLILSDAKHLQKILLNSLRNALNVLSEDDKYFPPIFDSQIILLKEVVEKIANNSGIELQEHFLDKIERTVEKFNSNVLKVEEMFEEVDDKSLIIPLYDDFDYKKIVSYIWIFINMRTCEFTRSSNSLEYLSDLSYEIENKIDSINADRIISRLIFLVGWRFKLRFTDILLDEIFRFQLVFRFLSLNIENPIYIKKNLKKWTTVLQNYDTSKFEDSFIEPFVLEHLTSIPKLDSIKDRMIDILRGIKSLSISTLKVPTFPKYRKGLETTKALTHGVRLAFSRLNEAGRGKSDTSKIYLSNVKVLENDITTICNQLDADIDQVCAEIHYMVSVVKKSIKDPALLSKLENKYINRRNTTSKRGLKSEELDYDSRPSKYPRLSDIDDYEYMDCKNITKMENCEKLSGSKIHSKVNFINYRDSSDIHTSYGDMLESRISHVNEPNSRTICIDPGKDKARPARFVEISSCPSRSLHNIMDRPMLCKKRKNLEGSKESKSLYNFQVTRVISKGAYGKICEAIDKFSNRRVALKRITLNKYMDEGIPQSILRETTILRSIRHENIVEFVDVVVDDLETIRSQITDFEMIVPKSFYFVFDYVEHDLKGLMESNMILSFDQISFFASQLFLALEFLHSNNIIHRDVTPGNLLISNRGKLKLTDFGNARFISRDVSLNQHIPLTPKSVPLFYRAPELLLEFESYGTEVDIWSTGCILYELLEKKHIFRFESDLALIEIIEEISKICGSPSQSVWSDISQSKFFVDLVTTGIAANYSRKIDDHLKNIQYDASDVLKQIFLWDPAKRINASKALNSNWLKSIRINSMEPEDFPEQDCHENSDPNLTVTELENVQQKENDTNIEINDQENYRQNNGSDLISNEQLETEVDDVQSQEELKKFVENLSGRILELSEVLELFRNEKPYTPEIGRGIVMHAARRWSNTEVQRTMLVDFMLNYLLTDQEKDILRL